MLLYPPEILKRILYHVTDRQDLAECSRVNTIWRQVSVPFLYERFRITSWFASDSNTAKTFLRNEYGRHVRHLCLNMSILEDQQGSHQLLRSLQVQRRTSSLRRRGFKLFPGSTNNNSAAVVDQQRRSSLIDFPMVQQQQQQQAPATTSSPQQQHHMCFTILAVLQSCAHVETVELDFHDRTFNMSRNAVFVFSQWQPTTVKKLHLMHLTRLIITPHLQTLTQWISQRCTNATSQLEELEISHCVATLFVTQQEEKQQQRPPTTIDLTGVSTIRISALSLWDPVSATNVLPEIRWPTTLRSLTILDSPDWLHHQSSDVLSSLPNSLESLTLAITPTPSPCASFFLLQHQQPQQQQHHYCKKSSSSVLNHASQCFQRGLCEVLAKCATLQDLSIEGFPTLTDAFLVYLWERSLLASSSSSSGTTLLRSLTLTRNARLCGQDIVDLILLHRGCYATDRIDLSGNPNMDTDFLHCVKLTSNYAALTW